MRRALPLVLLLAACKSDPPPRPGAPGATLDTAPAPTSAFPGFVARLDGNDLPLQSALAFSRGGSALHLTFSTVPIACENLTGPGIVREPGEITFDVTVAPLFGSSDAWNVTRAKLGRATRQGKLGSADVTSSDPGAQVAMRLASTLTFPAAASATTKDQKLELEGTITAQGCGVVALSEAEATPQPRFALELDGKRLDVRGATLVRKRLGSVELRLSTEPHDCANGPLGSDLAVMIALDDRGDAVQSVALEGYRLPQYMPAVLEPGSLFVRFERPLGDDATRATAEISGGASVKTHRLSVLGPVALSVCP
jgi:hypothetical protein